MLIKKIWFRAKSFKWEYFTIIGGTIILKIYDSLIDEQFVEFYLKL